MLTVAVAAGVPLVTVIMTNTALESRQLGSFQVSIYTLKGPVSRGEVSQPIQASLSISILLFFY